MLEGGWHFVPKDKASAKPAPASAHDNDTFPNATSDPLFGVSHLRDLYFKAQPDYSARFTVPVVWDKKENTIVNNESSEIVRFFNTAFNGELPADKAKLDLYPEDLKKEIDELNDWVYNDINNGVYKSGFASTQDAYEAAVKPLAKGLQKVEDRLSDGREFLMGDRLTEADVRYVVDRFYLPLFDSSFFFSLFIRLYTTIVRYDPVYYVHFKCNFGLGTFTLTRIMRQGSLLLFFSHCQSDTIIPICTSGSSVSTGIIPLSRILPTLTVRLCVSAYDYELKIILLFLFSRYQGALLLLSRSNQP